MKSTPDPLGHALFQERLDRLPALLNQYLNLPALQIVDPEPPQNIVITGIGSSEAHARYLCYLVNTYTESRAEFWPLLKFHQNTLPAKTAQHHLVVFSQGISPNAQIALKKKSFFKKTTLFTSSTEVGLEKAGKLDRIEFLKQVDDCVHFPEEDEFTILIRILGPMLGYVACIRFLNTLWPDTLPKFDLANCLRDTLSYLPEKSLNLEQSCIFIGNENLVTYGQNLIYKLTEGLFVHPPQLCDFLAFSHGSFQQIVADAKPVIIFTIRTERDQQLSKHVVDMLASVGRQAWVVESPLPEPHAILYYEQSLNLMLAEAMQDLKVNQRDWPGKGKDGALYALSE